MLNTNSIKLNVRQSINLIDKKLAVFDLDETLVHCITKDIKTADINLKIQISPGKTCKVNLFIIK